MDLSDTPAEAAFRARARAWIQEAAPAVWGEATATYGEAESAARSRQWQAALHEAGWAGLTWPREHGGQGLDAACALVFAEEQRRAGVHEQYMHVAVTMVGPTLIARGTPEQQASFLPAMLRGEHIWCQLFSEPGAGSDLASLSTSAVLDGDSWVVTGQKVWTSLAQHADYAVLLARTDKQAPKRHGITYLLLDMSLPGIDIRPLRQITGEAHFNEVFLDEVRVPATCAVGEVNEGWSVATNTLGSERLGIAGSGRDLSGAVIALAQATGASRDPVVRQRLALAWSRAQVRSYLGYRVRTAISQGTTVGSEGSLLKLGYCREIAEMGDLAMAVSGAWGMLAQGDAPDGGFWQRQFLGQWSPRFGGGTEQIQRNLIGERLLGLAREPSVP